MNVYAVSGAANKSRNTAEMLKSALEGALSVPGATGELVNLYDLSFRGCVGCHSCKLLDKDKFAKCAMRDDLSPVLEKAKEADVLLLGSPIYFSNVTGEMRSFLERLFFPGLTYNKDRGTTYAKRPKVGWVFTMNAPGEFYNELYSSLAGMSGRIIGETEYAIAFNTQQFDDYSQYAATSFDEEYVKKRHEEQFPLDCKAAYDMGRRLAGGESEDEQ